MYESWLVLRRSIREKLHPSHDIARNTRNASPKNGLDRVDGDPRPIVSTSLRLVIPRRVGRQPTTILRKRNLFEKAKTSNGKVPLQKGVFTASSIRLALSTAVPLPGALPSQYPKPLNIRYQSLATHHDSRVRDLPAA
jgi:hypothetical protein